MKHWYCLKNIFQGLFLYYKPFIFKAGAKKNFKNSSQDLLWVKLLSSVWWSIVCKVSLYKYNWVYLANPPHIEFTATLLTVPGMDLTVTNTG